MTYTGHEDEQVSIDKIITGKIEDLKIKEYHSIECPYCEQELDDVWQSFCDADDNEAEGIIGYECKECGLRFNLDGDEI